MKTRAGRVWHLTRLFAIGAAVMGADYIDLAIEERNGFVAVIGACFLGAAWVFTGDSAPTETKEKKP